MVAIAMGPLGSLSIHRLAPPRLKCWREDGIGAVISDYHVCYNRDHPFLEISIYLTLNVRLNPI